MAHLRVRYIQNMIEKAVHLSPLVGILGHRQVGKTTVLEKMCDTYRTLDKKTELNKAQFETENFLKYYPKSLQGIDECQLAPALFPALKEFVRIHKSPGQFLLSGSVRFTSRQAIRESLTGRIVNFELLPFSISELAHRELPQTITTILNLSTMDRVAQSLSNSKISGLEKQYNYYFEHGGLPGVCFIQNKNLRHLRIKEQLQTLLDRDVRLVYPTNLSFSQIQDFFRYIAQNQGQDFNYSAAQKAIGLSPVTQKKLLQAFEGIFLIRRLRIEGTKKGDIFYLEDQAESFFMLDGQQTEKDQLEQLAYRNLRTQWYYQLGSTTREFHFLTRGGARLPFCIEQGGKRLGMLPIEEELPNRSEKSSAASFLKKYENARVLFLHNKKRLHVIDERSLSAPVLFFA
ncbi:MAG TPA: AAA family ATPase [Pseudobdellovibrionaceae bacterium]